MDEEVFSPPFYHRFVSLRQLGNPNRILRLYALMRKARERVALFQEKAHRSKKEGKKRMRQIGSVEVPSEAFMSILKLD